MYDHGHDHPNVNDPPYPSYLNPYPYVPMHTPPLDEFGRCRGIWVYLRENLCGHNYNEQHAYEKLPFLAARAPCMHECCQTPPPPSPKPMNHVPDQSIHTPNATDCQQSPKEDMNNDSEPIVVRVYTKAKVDYSLTIRDRKVILAPSNPSDPLQQWIKDEKFGKDIKDDQGFSSFALVNKATGQAIKHSIGVTYPVQLTDYNPEKLDKSMDLRAFQNLVGCGMAHKLFYGTGLTVITKNGPSLVINICGVWNFYVKETSTAMGDVHRHLVLSFICILDDDMGHKLNDLSDSLFDVYTNVESAKELWDSLESKYMAKDSSSKNSLILGQYIQHGLKMDESNSVLSILDKLPPSSKDFKHTLKHGKDDLSLVQLGSHLRIEESLRTQESNKGKGKEVVGPLVNMIKESGKNKNNKQNKRKKRCFKDNNDGSGSNKKLKLECWKCGKTSHFKSDCRSGNKKNNASASGSGKGSKDQSQDQGIIHEITSPYTPQQNGVAERKNRALKEMVNSMLSYSGLSEGFWEKSAVVRLPDPKRKTLGEKCNDCIFVGYVERSNAYRFYIIEPNDSVSINSIIESRDAIFDENRFSSVPRPKDIIPNSNESQRDDHSDDVPSEISEPRKGKRVQKAKSYGSDFQLYLVGGSRDQVRSQYSYCYSIDEDPRTYNKAIWIFKKKMKVDGTIDKFKARLVIQCFRQKEGIDYFDTYASVARITTFRLLLALAAIHNLVIHQMDVKIAFLNGDLDEEVYMKQPKGFVMPDQNQVDKTKKFLSLKFSVKDIGEADVILGIKIKCKNKRIVITQSHYIEKILKKFNREDCSSVSTLIDPVEKLKPNTGKPVNQLEYSRAIGCLMYAVTSTRPDIAYVVGRLSRFTSNPSRQH
uniref:CCHC-type domain-containing protein n=1 Tax=Tanacetum cinerariifolium TaxID=118510 RepID=A0A6L2MLD2_TANCI|nr:hypothetical protein [Tanacetum cinerariifolium]